MFETGRTMLDIDEKIPPDYMSFSEAVRVTTRGMWGGVAVVNRPRALGRNKWPRAVESHRLIKAAQALTSAVEKGKLRIYLAVTNQSAGEPVPKETICKLIKPNGHLTDYAYRPSLKTAGRNGELYQRLLSGRFVVQTREFRGWYRAELAKGLWPSQTSKLKKKRGRGRPTKQSTSLGAIVQQLVAKKEWEAKRGAPALRRILIAAGHQDLPSDRTLLRLVDSLAQETRHSALRRPKRNRRPGPRS
jgi:hypothetical protein